MRLNMGMRIRLLRAGRRTLWHIPTNTHTPSHCHRHCRRLLIISYFNSNETDTFATLHTHNPHTCLEFFEFHFIFHSRFN